MIALMGAVLCTVSCLSFWYMLPTHGNVHWLMTMPALEAYVPVVIIGGIVLGFVMMVAAVI